MYWKGYSRERAAQDLLDIVQTLSKKAYVFEPIESSAKQLITKQIKYIQEELQKVGLAVSRFPEQT